MMCAAAVEDNDISNAAINKNLVSHDYFCTLKPFMYIDAKIYAPPTNTCIHLQHLYYYPKPI